MFGGYFVYNHYHKVSLAQYYFDIGEYEKASDLDVGDISRNASSIVSAMGWKEEVDKYLKYNNKWYIKSFDTKIYLIYSNNLLFEHGAGDKNTIDIINKHYKDIADYLGVSTIWLDELNEMDMDKRVVELEKILYEKRKIYIW